MKCQLAVLADAANLSVEGKLNILGEFNTFAAVSAPMVHPLMYFVAKLQISAGDGAVVNLRLRVIDGEGQQLVFPELRIQGRGEHPSDGTLASMPIIVPIAQALFREFGEYTFELRGPSGPLLAEVPLYVRQVAAG